MHLPPTWRLWLLLGIVYMKVLTGLSFPHRLQALVSRASTFRRCLSTDTLLRASKVKPIPPLTVNAYVDKEILEWAKLKDHHRKSKLLVSTKTREWSLSLLRDLISTRYPSLSDQPYKLRYKPHHFDPDTKLEPFIDDEHLTAVFNKFIDSQRALQVYVQVNPGVFPPNVQTKVDPLESHAYTLVSFYAFADISDPEELSFQFRQTWEPFKALGRVYVAKEGVNAQMAVPSNAFNEFMDATRKYPFFSNVRFNVDHEMTREDYFASQPFRALHIRVRKQIVADGLDEELDWSKAGNELLPLEWHQQISDPKAIILDCRNTYETDVGRFQNAIPLNTTVFRESWDAMEEILQDAPKDAPIYTYCTGGIRCVKINAFLEQKLGFNNTHRLKGGVIYYTKTLEHIEAGKSTDIIDPTLTFRKPEEDPQHTRHIAESKFLGVNYVFDDRMGARVTADVFTGCGTCGETCDAFTNCKNFECNVLFVQCIKCRTAYGNCCSKACEARYLAANKQRKGGRFAGKAGDVPDDLFHSPPLAAQPSAHKPHPAKSSSVKTHATVTSDLAGAMEDYCVRHSMKEPALLAQLRQETEANFDPKLARMISGPSQGALLSLIATISGARSVLELGCFTGYSTLCLVTHLDHWTQALTDKIALTAEEIDRLRAYHRTVDTCEIEEGYADIAQRYFDRSAVGDKITLHRLPASELLSSLRQQGRKFDMIFIDANKKNYLTYLQEVLGNASHGTPSLLNQGGLVLVDNTLWKGLVLHHTEEGKVAAPNPADFGAAARMMKVAESMHELNEYGIGHPALQVLQLPMRDGLTIMRYNPST